MSETLSNIEKALQSLDGVESVVKRMFELEGQRDEYVAMILRDLSVANEEINMLRDIVVTYGDRLRMGTVHRMDWQQCIDRAFERD